MKLEDFNVGVRVYGKYFNVEFFGTVRRIDFNKRKISVERDDGVSGGGDFYNSKRTWSCRENEGKVLSDGDSGEPLCFEKDARDSKCKNTTGGEKMKLDEIKKTNLKEAKKQFEEQQKNAEIEYAKNELRRATDEINRLDREIKAREESKKPYLEILEKFKA